MTTPTEGLLQQGFQMTILTGFLKYATTGQAHGFQTNPTVYCKWTYPKISYNYAGREFPAVFYHLGGRHRDFR